MEFRRGAVLQWNQTQIRKIPPHAFFSNHENSNFKTKKTPLRGLASRTRHHALRPAVTRQPPFFYKYPQIPLHQTITTVPPPAPPLLSPPAHCAHARRARNADPGEMVSSEPTPCFASCACTPVCVLIVVAPLRCR